GGDALLPGRHVLGTGTRHLMWHVRHMALPAFDFRRNDPRTLLCGLWQLAHSTVAVAVDEPNSGSGSVAPTVIFVPVMTCVTNSPGVAARAVSYTIVIGWSLRRSVPRNGEPPLRILPDPVPLAL